MSRRSRESDQSRDVTQYWIDRGYRPELATIDPSANEDPLGEEAYQRAFAVASRSNPPRLPNPSYYPNSPSARDYLARKSGTVPASSSTSTSTSAERASNHHRLRNGLDPEASPIARGELSKSTSPASSTGRAISLTLPPMSTQPSPPSMSRRPTVLSTQFPDSNSHLTTSNRSPEMVDHPMPPAPGSAPGSNRYRTMPGPVEPSFITGPVNPFR